jgi:hypothetical protein
VIALVEGQVGACLGSRRKLAGILLTAHFLSISGAVSAASGGAAEAALSSVSVGSVSLSYDTASGVGSPGSMADAALAETQYGAEYLRLVKISGLGAMLL